MQSPPLYSDLLKEHGSSWNIPYSSLLQTSEWKNFRQRVLLRDDHTCLMCKRRGSEKHNNRYYRVLTPEEQNASQEKVTFDLTGTGEMMVEMITAKIHAEPIENPIILHVHHKYYVFGHEPWEYPDHAIITVCHGCHMEIHDSLIIPVYVDETKKERLPLTPCTRCLGTGYIREYHYYQNGICFRCNGRKFEEYLRKP